MVRKKEQEQSHDQQPEDNNGVFKKKPTAWTRNYEDKPIKSQRKDKDPTIRSKFSYYKGKVKDPKGEFYKDKYDDLDNKPKI